jgi:hypothetical protein
MDMRIHKLEYLIAGVLFLSIGFLRHLNRPHPDPIHILRLRLGILGDWNYKIHNHQNRSATQLIHRLYEYRHPARSHRTSGTASRRAAASAPTPQMVWRVTRITLVIRFRSQKNRRWRECGWSDRAPGQNAPGANTIVDGIATAAESGGLEPYVRQFSLAGTVVLISPSRYPSLAYRNVLGQRFGRVRRRDAQRAAPAQPRPVFVEWPGW